MVGDRLTLQDCIRTAQQNQLAIQAQRAAIGVAAQQEAIARSYYLPQLSFQMRYTSLEEPKSVDIPSPITGDLANVFTDAAAYFGIARAAGSAVANAALNQPDLPPFSTAKQYAATQLPSVYRVYMLGQNFVTTQLALVQPLWTGGKIRYRNEQADLATRAAGRDLAKVEQETTFNVTRAYLTIVLTGELQQVAEDTAGRFRAIQALVRNLVDAGNEHVTMADFHRARSLWHLAEAEKTGLVQLRERARAALRLAMGVEPQSPLEIVDHRLIVGQRDVDLAEVLGQALAQRPEMAKANIGVRIAELERQLAKAEFHPDIALFGSFSTIYDDGHFANPNDREEWAAGVTGQVNVFTGGRRVAQRRQADWRRVQAARLRELLAQVVSQEAQDAYLEYLEACQRLRLDSQAVEEAKKALARYDDLLAGGLIADERMPDYFEDLILARRFLTEALVRQYQDMYNCNVALARIRLVTASDDYQTFLENDGADRSVGDAALGTPASHASAGK